MYGSTTYGNHIYGGESGIGVGETIEPSLEPPVIDASFTVYAPAVFAEGVIAVPLVSSSFQVFAPLITIRGRPLAEDIRVMSVKSEQAIASFHVSLGSSLYPGALERERRVLFGTKATCTLYTVTPAAGAQVVLELDSGWSARRIPTIESSGPETWRLEITDDRVDWNMLKNVTKVRLRGATDEEQIYEVLQRFNAMKPGKVYQIQMQASCNIDPS